MMQLPTHLYHYFEQSRGPLRSLSDLAPEAAEAVLDGLRQRGDGFASQRHADYLSIRRELEAFVRARFSAKGGEPLRATPHYFTLGACDWVKTWYRHGSEIHIPLAEIDARRVSFTYGDTFPAMRFGDGKPHRRQVYTLAELPDLVATYGLPQECNPDGKLGPDRYVEAQVWYDPPPIRGYRSIS